MARTSSPSASLSTSLPSVDDDDDEEPELELPLLLDEKYSSASILLLFLNRGPAPRTRRTRAAIPVLDLDLDLGSMSLRATLFHNLSESVYCLQSRMRECASEWRLELKGREEVFEVLESRQAGSSSRLVSPPAVAWRERAKVGDLRRWKVVMYS
ncbi:hypothetical protein Mapa_006213 [Marchantia paleacea]|nr:hypothetical protein Mapa_006213 [Marchantia paleacea]